jgi:hypothetical protein
VGAGRLVAVGVLGELVLVDVGDGAFAGFRLDGGLVGPIRFVSVTD